MLDSKIALPRHVLALYEHASPRNDFALALPLRYHPPGARLTLLSFSPGETLSIPTYLPIYLSTYLPTYLPTRLLLSRRIYEKASSGGAKLKSRAANLV